jgi:hypothetical protein
MFPVSRSLSQSDLTPTDISAEIDWLNRNPAGFQGSWARDRPTTWNLRQFGIRKVGQPDQLPTLTRTSRHFLLNNGSVYDIHDWLQCKILSNASYQKRDILGKANLISYEELWVLYILVQITWFANYSWRPCQRRHMTKNVGTWQ